MFSIRILVAMSALKEGFGCSDEDLFEKCEFDLLTRKALGMELLTDVTPSIDTYYLFRRRICEYQERTGIDLMQLCFEQLAGNQVRLLKISGKCVRMDSKLIGSNIARQSRYELIHTTLVKFLKTCTLSDLSPEQEERAKEYLKEDSSKTVFTALIPIRFRAILPELAISSWRCWQLFLPLPLHMIFFNVCLMNSMP